MNETQKNIKRYKAALPGLRDRIAASAMLLMVSLSMMVSASFAWYTISSAPEVSMMATTVASNGNLEIALAHGTVKDEAADRERPDEVALGDSSSTEGQTLVGANITWGNLVNLSDSAYGLSHVSLRPAKLSENNQSRTPLYGVDYTLDGRIVESSEYYRYASFDSNMGQSGSFVAGEGVQYGVRAISSMIMSNESEQLEINQLGDALDDQMTATKAAYNLIIKSDSKVSGTYMNALTKMLEKFVNNKAEEVLYNNPDYADMVEFSPANYAENVDSLQNLMSAFRDMLREESETLRQLINMHIFDITGEKTDFVPAEAEGEIKGDPVREIGRSDAKRKELQDLGVPKELLDLLKAHVKDYDAIQNAIDGIEANLKPMVQAGETVYWDLSYKKYVVPDATDDKDKFLDYYISNLVNLSKTYVGPADSYPDYVSKLTGTNMKSIYTLASLSDALGVMGATPIEVEIGGGVLLTTEQRIGSLLYQNNLPYGTNVTIYVNPRTKGLGSAAIGALGIKGDKTAAVRTSAPTVAKLDEQINDAKKLVPEPKNMVSKDIYGFAVDLWVRTNAKDTVLTLEGMTIYEEVDATCTNLYGDISTVQIATGKLPGETEDETVEHVVEVYVIYEEVAAVDENGEPILDAEGKPTMVWANNVYDALDHRSIGIKEEMESEAGGKYEFVTKKTKIYKGYDGVNRVWQEMIDGGVVPENGTTQGTGSCYVFYASPSEQPKILELLRSFTIAFLDGNDNLVATAKLATEEAFEINGKVTVPLKIVTGAVYVDTVDVDGTTTEEVNKLGIMTLPRSVPTWLTAIVYLDGELLSNENVLAAGVIEGRLNLQFGSSVDINSQKNEPLLLKARTVTAVVEGNGTVDDGSTDEPQVEFTYDKAEKIVTARVTIVGDQPKNVTAFFTRMVGQNQGTRMETMTFTEGAEEGEWVATCVLEKPGEYRLNSVVADGTEYVLEKKPGVKIKGQNIESVTCDPEGGTVLTSDDYYNVSVRAVIDADKELQPDQVRVLFTYGDNKEATAILGYDGDKTWTGNLRITESGSYTMTYLVMDGNTDKLTEAQQKSFFVRLGVKAEIQCADTVIRDKDGNVVENKSEEPGTYSILYKPQGDGQGYDVAMKVHLRDSSNKEIARMSGVRMYYQIAGTDAMDADLIWIDDADGGYYLAEMTFQNAGAYDFGRLEYTYSEMRPDSTTPYTVDSTITKTTEATRIAAVPPDPPKIDKDTVNQTPAEQYAPNGGAVMTVQIFDSSAATVKALIVNKATGQEDWVDGYRVSTDNLDPVDENSPKTVERYTFAIRPNTGSTAGKKSADGTVSYEEDCQRTLDGVWEIKTLRMQQVTDDQENYYPGPAGEYREFDMTSYGIQTEVTQKIFVHVIDADGDKLANNERVFTFGLGADGKPSGVFMQSYGGTEGTYTGITGMKIKINKWNGEAVEDLGGDENMDLKVLGDDDGSKLYVNHEFATTEDYGGYTIDSDVNTDTVWGLSTSDSITYNTGTLTLPYAGEYNVQLKYQIGDETNTTTINVLQYKVYSVKPTAYFTEGTTTDKYDTKITYTLDRIKRPTFITSESKQNSYTASKAILYGKAKADGGTIRRGEFTAPTLCIKIEGITDGYRATLTSTSGDFTVYNDGNGVISMALGQVSHYAYISKVHPLQKYTGVGDQTIETMVITKDGATYTVELTTKLEIENPSSVNP